MVVCAKISRNEEEKIKQLVERGRFINTSDFVRTAIREFLEGFPSVEEATKRSNGEGGSQ